MSRQEPPRRDPESRAVEPRAEGSGAGILARLRAAGLHPRKGLGQHFLHDPKLLSALAEEAGVSGSDTVLEVGTGPGTLTRELARRAARVLGVEVDPRMLEMAREELRAFENVSWLSCNILEAGSRLSGRALEVLEGLGPFLWVSNLPYNIATTLILALCEARLEWTRAALLVQEEVAQRLAASPGDDAYGPASLLRAYWATARLGRKVPPGAFWPPPRVQSRVIHLERAASLGSHEEYGAYRAWVRRLFHARRKQVGGLLRKAIGDAQADSLLAREGWKPSLRPENLSPNDLLLLAREFPAFSN